MQLFMCICVRACRCLRLFVGGWVVCGSRTDLTKRQIDRLEAKVRQMTQSACVCACVYCGMHVQVDVCVVWGGGGVVVGGS